MGEVKHTPRPWMNARRSAGAHIHSDAGEVAWLRSYLGIPDDEIEANASLIAAAPDLLAFAKAYAETWVVAGGMPIDDEDLKDMCLSAIAKAEGRAESLPLSTEGEEGR